MNQVQQSPRSHTAKNTYTLVEWLNQQNKKQQGMTAVHYASFNGDLRLVKEMIANGADIR